MLIYVFLPLIVGRLDCGILLLGISSLVEIGVYLYLFCHLSALSNIPFVNSTQVTCTAQGPFEYVSIYAVADRYEYHVYLSERV